MTEPEEPSEQLPVPDDFPRPGEDDIATLGELIETVGFIVAEDDAFLLESAATTNPWWGPVTYSGGIIDATSYYRTQGYSVESLIGAYLENGNPWGSNGWSSHGQPPRGALVGRRWLFRLPPPGPTSPTKMLDWWKSGGVWVTPWFRLRA